MLRRLQQLHVLQPVQDEQRALNAPQLVQDHGQAVLTRVSEENIRPGLLLYFRLLWPMLSALLPVRKFWPSDDDGLSSPQCSANGCRNYALTRSARTAP
ncbi:hypothetical protein ADT33_00680 [Xylella fastidiosa]|nr:hypothetical protein ADT33_00680 [Xylella fastidiosa]